MRRQRLWPRLKGRALDKHRSLARTADRSLRDIGTLANWSRAKLVDAAFNSPSPYRSCRILNEVNYQKCKLLLLHGAAAAQAQLIKPSFTFNCSWRWWREQSNRNCALNDATRATLHGRSPQQQQQQQCSAACLPTCLQPRCNQSQKLGQHSQLQCSGCN